MTNKSPKITVFMAVYNGQKYLKEAIDSVLSQTFKNFELLIINDGSTDDSVSIIESYSDSRIRLLQNEKNLGITGTRNRGIKEMRGEYLTVLDCDDIAPPKRLAKQFNFLEKNPDFGLVGGQTQIIDDQSRPTGTIWKNAYSPEEMKAVLLFACCISNPAVTIRAAALPPDGYLDFEGACDYDLWQRMSRHWKIWNLPEIMVKYRIHNQNMSTSQAQRQRQMADMVIKKQLANLKIFPSDEELIIHRTNYLYRGKEQGLMEFLEQREKWLQKLNKANLETNFYPSSIFSQVLANRWLISCNTNASGSGQLIWKKYWQSSLSRKKKEWLPLLKFATRCFIKK